MRFLGMILFSGALAILIADCGGKSLDASRMVHAAPLQLPDGDYAYTAWLTENEIALLYVQKPNDDMWNYQITVYDRTTRHYLIIPVSRMSRKEPGRAA